LTTTTDHALKLPELKENGSTSDDPVTKPLIICDAPNLGAGAPAGRLTDIVYSTVPHKVI